MFLPNVLFHVESQWTASVTPLFLIKNRTFPRCVENTECTVKLGRCMVLLISVLGNQRQPACSPWLQQVCCHGQEGLRSANQCPVPSALTGKAHTICWQEKTDLYLQSLKVVFQEREHTSFSPPNPCSINSSWQAERTLIAGDEGEAAAGWRQNQWHGAKSFIKRIIASTWQSVKCLFSYGFSF